MPVSEAKAGTRPEANHIYVIPPRCYLSISDGVLQTQPRPEHGRNLPVDSFLQALPQTRAASPFGVVLSGVASDGTLGLRAIRAVGGATFAQEAGTATYDGMPAMAAGVVDLCCRPPESPAAWRPSPGIPASCWNRAPNNQRKWS